MPGVRILLVSALRNEGPHLLEWIAHHRGAGVTDFLITSNDCEDGTDAMLDALQAAGIVIHLPLAPAGRRPVQWQALRAAGAHPLVSEVDWVLCIDCDEFVSLAEPFSGLPDMIAALPEGTDAVTLPWRLFGNGGHIAARQGLTLERFTSAAPEDIALPSAHFFKTLFRRDAFGALGVHRPKQADGGKPPCWADAGGRPLPPAFGGADGRINLFGLPGGREMVELNHYSLRSAEEFMLKRARGLPNHADREVGLGYWVERNFNADQAPRIARMLPATRAALADLHGIGGLPVLETAARDWHRDRLAQLMRDPGEVQLFWQLVLAGDSVPPLRIEAQAHLRRLAAARGAHG